MRKDAYLRNTTRLQTLSYQMEHFLAEVYLRARATLFQYQSGTLTWLKSEYTKVSLTAFRTARTILCTRKARSASALPTRAVPSLPLAVGEPPETPFSKSKKSRRGKFQKICKGYFWWGCLELLSLIGRAPLLDIDITYIF